MQKKYCWLFKTKQELQDDMYQKIAAEMNLSETAFIIRLNSKDDFSSGIFFETFWNRVETVLYFCAEVFQICHLVVLYFIAINQEGVIDANENESIWDSGKKR